MIKLQGVLQRELEEITEKFNGNEKAAYMAMWAAVRRMKESLPDSIHHEGKNIFIGEKWEGLDGKKIVLCSRCFSQEATAFSDNPLEGACQDCVQEENKHRSTQLQNHHAAIREIIEIEKSGNTLDHYAEE